MAGPADRGRLWGEVDALLGKPRDAVTAFNRSMTTEHLGEDDRPAYAKAYFKAFDAEATAKREREARS